MPWCCLKLVHLYNQLNFSSTAPSSLQVADAGAQLLPHLPARGGLRLGGAGGARGHVANCTRLLPPSFSLVVACCPGPLNSVYHQSCCAAHQICNKCQPRKTGWLLGAAFGGGTGHSARCVWMHIELCRSVISAASSTVDHWPAEVLEQAIAQTWRRPSPATG